MATTQFERFIAPALMTDAETLHGVRKKVADTLGKFGRRVRDSRYGITRYEPDEYPEGYKPDRVVEGSTLEE